MSAGPRPASWPARTVGGRFPRGPAPLVLLWLLSAPTVEGRPICGTVELAGRPVVEGFVSLEPDDRSWREESPLGGSPARREEARHRTYSPVRDGKFCIPSPAPGNYRPFLTLQLYEAYQPLSVGLSYPLPDGPTRLYRLSVDERGKAQVYDPTGKLHSGDGPLPLAYHPPPPRDGWAALDLQLTFPSAPRLDLRDDPLLVLAYVNTEPERVPYPGEIVYLFAQWVTTATAGGVSLKLPIAAGYLHSLQVWSRRWGPAMMHPPIPSLDVQEKAVGPDRPMRVEVQMARAGSLSATVRLPDGRRFLPFHPHDVDDRRRSALCLGLADVLSGMVFDGACIGEAGTYQMGAVAGGLRTVVLQGVGRHFPWSLPPPALVWVEAGRKTHLDFRLGDLSRVGVAADGAQIEPLPGASQSWRYPLERWVVGLEAGVEPGPGLSPLVFGDEPPPFSLQQKPTGKWESLDFTSLNVGDVTLARTAPGSYDVYLVERTDPLWFPDVHDLPAWVRVLAVRRGVRLEKDSVTELKFPGPLPAAGGAALAGSVRFARTPSMAELRGVKTLVELEVLITPRVDLYDGDRHVATAYASLPREELAAFAQALADGDGARVEALLGGRARPFGVQRLPAGRYRARVSAHDLPPREIWIEIREDSQAPLEIDLGAP